MYPRAPRLFLASNGHHGAKKKTGKIWIGGLHDGIAILDLESNNVRHLRKSDKTLLQDTIGAIFQDRQSRIWINGATGGVQVIDLKNVSPGIYLII